MYVYIYNYLGVFLSEIKNIENHLHPPQNHFNWKCLPFRTIIYTYLGSRFIFNRPLIIIISYFMHIYIYNKSFPFRWKQLLLLLIILFNYYAFVFVIVLVRFVSKSLLNKCTLYYYLLNGGHWYFWSMGPLKSDQSYAYRQHNVHGQQLFHIKKRL